MHVVSVVYRVWFLCDDSYHLKFKGMRKVGDDFLWLITWQANFLLFLKRWQFKTRRRTMNTEHKHSNAEFFDTLIWFTCFSVFGLWIIWSKFSRWISNKMKKRAMIEWGPMKQKENELSTGNEGDGKNSIAIRRAFYISTTL